MREQIIGIMAGTYAGKLDVLFGNTGFKHYEAVGGSQIKQLMDVMERSFDIIATMLKDVLNTRVQESDTSYKLLDRRGKKVHNCQHEFYDEAKKKLALKKSNVLEEHQFVPLTGENFKKNIPENDN